MSARASAQHRLRVRTCALHLFMCCKILYYQGHIQESIVCKDCQHTHQHLTAHATSVMFPPTKKVGQIDVVEKMKGRKEHTVAVTVMAVLSGVMGTGNA